MANEQPAMTTDGRRHPGIFKQVDRLVAASEAEAELAFMHRLMALCSLPRTNPGNSHQYTRVNGPYKLVLLAGAHNKLPYGNIPRLLSIWMCSEATEQQSRELFLGNSLSAFLGKVGIPKGGGARTRLREQMDRLFNASVSLIYEDGRDKVTVNALIADRTEFWWNERRPDERTLWQSKIVLSENFFEEIISHPVPLDMNILKALTRNALGLDLYIWLTYRVFGLDRPFQLTWPQLYRQFGADPANATDKNIVQDFRTKAIRELKKIKIAWPGLDYATPAGVLELRPSEPSVPSRRLRLLSR